MSVQVLMKLNRSQRTTMRHLMPFAASEESPLLSGGGELLLAEERSKMCQPMQ